MNIWLTRDTYTPENEFCWNNAFAHSFLPTLYPVFHDCCWDPRWIPQDPKAIYFWPDQMIKSLIFPARSLGFSIFFPDICTMFPQFSPIFPWFSQLFHPISETNRIHRIGNVLQPGASGLTSRMGQFIAELPYEIPLSTAAGTSMDSLWLCQQFAIENGHWNSGFPIKNGDFP